MTSGNNFMHGLLSSAGNLSRQAGIEFVEEAYRKGFNEAGTICVSVLSRNIDNLLNKIKSGSYLTDEEQFLLSRLTEMKSATEQELYDFRGSAVPDERR